MKRGWPKTLLRIEAEGYRPLVSEPLARKTGIVLDVALEPDEGIAGRVVTPDGKPAGGATVAVCTWTNEVTVRDGALQYGHHAQRLRGLVQTADDGSFRLPGEVDPWVLVVAHPSGYAEPTAAEFGRQSTVPLEPWGRLEGEFVVDGQPVAGQPVNIGAGRGDAPVVLHYSAGDITTDAAGKFTADRLPPVKMYVAPLFKHGDASYNLLWFSGLIEIQPGEVTRISLPRPGQPVTGKVTMPEDGDLSLGEIEIRISVVLSPPMSVAGFGDQANQQYAAYAAFMASDLGKSFRRDAIPVKPDGTFRVAGLPESQYFLRAMAYRKPATPAADRGNAVARHMTRVQIPALSDPPETVDLGIITLSVSTGR